VLHRIVVHEDETAEVGSELAVISGDGDDAAAAPAADGQEAAPADAGDQTAANQTPADQTPAAGDGDEAATVPQEGAAQAVDEPSTEKPAEVEAPAAESDSAPEPASGSDSDAGSGSASDSGSDSGQGSGEGTAVTMPALGESVTEGTITRWLKQVGDQVEADEPLLEVSTDKVDTEIPSPAAGTLLEITVGEDETAAVGARLAVIGAAGGSAPAKAAPDQAAPDQAVPDQAVPDQAAPDQAAADQAAASAPAPSKPAPAPAAKAAPAQAAPAAAATGATERVNGEDTAGYVTPLVRKLASDNGIDLGSVQGTGVGGRIRKQDVLEAAEAQRAAAQQAEAAAAERARAAATQAAPATPAPVPAAATGQPAARPEPSPLRGRTEKLSRMRSLIARRMVESLQISAQLTTVVEVDVTRIARLRDSVKAGFQRREGVKLSFLPFFALAAVDALRVHPNVNAAIDLEAGTVTYHDAEHLGMAVDTDRGLMVPVIRNAGDLNLAGLARRIADLAERTRTNRVTPDELSGGTFTLTNTGSRGALFDTPIINQPQVAILGTGAVVRRAVVVDDGDLGEIIVPRSMVYLALSYDHRLVDGADAARFLSTIKQRLEAGSFEAELGL
jgi:2-oxoglutarate dehydrogenase E2 component (dihydrolipoamide succinyltransferase)